MKKLMSVLTFILIIALACDCSAYNPITSDSLLIQAIKEGKNFTTIKKLLKSGKILVNQLGVDGKTALDIAVEFGNSKVAILLSKYGGKVTREDNQFFLKSMFNQKRKFYLIIGSILFYYGTAFFALGFLPLLPIAACFHQASTSAQFLSILVGISGICIGSTPLLCSFSQLKKARNLTSNLKINWMLEPYAE